MYVVHVEYQKTRKSEDNHVRCGGGQLEESLGSGV